ncbi:hypothetical protein KC929_02555 [Patescibacteria group bacterium]|nr:hypothetical protein [Patescibacteria group bacterium]
MKAIKMIKGYTIAFKKEGVTRVAYFNEEKKFINLVGQKRFDDLLSEGYEMYSVEEDDFKFPELWKYHHVWGRGKFSKIGMKWRIGMNRWVEQHICSGSSAQKIPSSWECYDNNTPANAEFIQKNYEFAKEFCRENSISNSVFNEIRVLHYMSLPWTEHQYIIRAVLDTVKELEAL